MKGLIGLAAVLVALLAVPAFAAGGLTDLLGPSPTVASEDLPLHFVSFKSGGVATDLLDSDMLANEIEGAKAAATDLLDESKELAKITAGLMGDNYTSIIPGRAERLARRSDRVDDRVTRRQDVEAAMTNLPSRQRAVTEPGNSCGSGSCGSGRQVTEPGNSCGSGSCSSGGGRRGLFRRR